MTTINFGSTVSLKQAATLIMTNPKGSEEAHV